jgi:hypothetical protein
MAFSLRDCLRSKYKASDGKISEAITKLSNNHRSINRYRCNSCPVNIIVGVKNLQIHVLGKRHMQSLWSSQKPITSCKFESLIFDFIIYFEFSASHFNRQDLQISIEHTEKSSQLKRSITPISSHSQPTKLKRMKKDNESENSTFSNLCSHFSVIEQELGSIFIECLRLQLEFNRVEKSHPKNCTEIIMMNDKNAIFLAQVKDQLVSLIERDMVPLEHIHSVQIVVRDIKMLLEKYPKAYQNVKHAKVDKNYEKDEDELCNEDLIFLVENFEDLNWTEKNNLVRYLSDLESKDPNRVKLLEQNVNINMINV